MLRQDWEPAGSHFMNERKTVRTPQKAGAPQLPVSCTGIEQRPGIHIKLNQETRAHVSARYYNSVKASEVDSQAFIIVNIGSAFGN